MSQSVFACLRFSKCMYVYAYVCIPAQSSVDLCGAPQCPLLILSQNGCCQAEKLPNGAATDKLIHNCRLSGLIVSNMKVIAHIYIGVVCLYFILF